MKSESGSSETRWWWRASGVKLVVLAWPQTTKTTSLLLG